MLAPLVVLSFNRPQFLRPVLESLRAQHGKGVGGREVHLFQDGAVNRFSRIRYAADSEINESVESFRQYFPAGTVHSFEDNIGICENFYRAEHYVFEERQFECAYFFEDDLVLSPVYLEMMDRLQAWAHKAPNVAYFAAYGNYYAHREEIAQRRRELMTLDHHWAFGLLRHQWQRMQPLLDPFYKIVRGTDYSRRHHRDIFKLYEPLDASPRASSQDAAKAFACDRLGLWRANTVVPFAKYIGVTGQHMTPEAFHSIGFDRVIIANDPVNDLQYPDDAWITTRVAELRSLYREIRANEYSQLVNGLPARKYNPVRKCSRNEIAYGRRLFLGQELESDTVIDECLRRAGTVIEFVSGLVDSVEQKAVSESSGRPCTREDIVYIYRLCLHRDPDSENVIQDYLSKNKLTLALTREIWNSDERRNLWARVVMPLPPKDPPAKVCHETDSKPISSLPATSMLKDDDPNLPVYMQKDELDLFVAFLRSAHSYVEFGCGGSTVLATSIIEGSIISLDSSQGWLDRVARACAVHAHLSQPKLIHVDIGPTGDWGRPIDDSCKDLWPLYATTIWEVEGANRSDLYLIDGRFRVSCFVETLLRCRADAVLLIRDFASRPEYHVIREFAREIAVSSSLSAFVRRHDFDANRAIGILQKKRYEPG